MLAWPVRIDEKRFTGIEVERVVAKGIVRQARFSVIVQGKQGCYRIGGYFCRCERRYQNILVSRQCGFQNHGSC